jgi:hypothetical protein
MSQRIEPLTPERQAWIAQQIEDARAFVATYAPHLADEDLTLDGLDQAWAAWLDTQEADAVRVQQVVACLGATFGQFLVNTTLLAWVMATDHRGSELAVHGLPGKGDVLVHPAHLVAKHWERRQSGFFRHAYHQIVEHIRTLQK